MSKYRVSRFPSSLESIAVVVVLAIASLWPASTVAAEDRLNVIFMLADDQGYGGFGGRHVSTPRIDQMAAEGSRLTSLFASPPRSALPRVRH